MYSFKGWLDVCFGQKSFASIISVRYFWYYITRMNAVNQCRNGVSRGDQGDVVKGDLSNPINATVLQFIHIASTPTYR